MDRSTNPTPINPNAKYLPSTISNVLNSIRKYDQGTLAWPTGPTKWTKKLCRVPLASTASSLISNPRGSKSKYCERVNKKNTFYKILQASQDQPCLEKSARTKRIELKPHADDIYNDMYDIVKAYLKIKKPTPPEVNQGQRDASPKEAPPMNEIYRVKPWVAENTTHQKCSKGEGEKSMSPTAKIPIVEFYRPPKKSTEQRPHFVTETHKSVSKSKIQKTGIHKRRKLAIKEANKGQNIVQENSKDSAKARHGSSTAVSHRKQANKAQKRNTDNHLQKVNAKKSVQLHKKSPKDDPHLNQITKAVQERVLGDSKKSSRFQHASAKLENCQDNPRVSVKIQEKSLEIKDYLKDISKFSSKAKHYQDNFKETTKLKQIIPADQRPARWVFKPQKTIYSKVSKIKMLKNIANKSNNHTVHSILKDIYKTRGAKSNKSIIEERLDNTGKSKIQEIITEGKNSIEEGKPNNTKKSKIPESSIDDQQNIIEGKLNNKTEKRTPIEAYELRLEMKTKAESIQKIQRKRILKARNTENHRKKARKIQHNKPIGPKEPYEPPPINLSTISSVTPEPAQPSRLSQIRRSTLETRKSRKLSVASTTYQEKLWKLKEYLNNMDGDHTEEISLDLEGILESDLLYYPYNDIYKSTAEDKGNNEVKKIKKKPKPLEKGLKPTEKEKRTTKPFEKKSACLMCQAIRRPVDDAPFLVQMREDQKRHELLAYRAHIAMCNKPSQRSRIRPLAICDLDKKLYTLEDKDIVFTCPKRSNSSIFPSSSKTKACLKRCHSFTFPKESSPIICP